jgi:hypothetical protein
MRGVAHSQRDVRRVLLLVGEGLSDYEIARRTRIPRSTVLRWRHGHLPRASSEGPRCPECGHGEHDFASLPGTEYAYLLGQYLGDGTIYRVSRTHALRISSDAQYTGIIEECCDAIEVLRTKRPRLRRHSDRRLVDILSYCKAWPCLFPQHGRGRKHTRIIALAPTGGAGLTMFVSWVVTTRIRATSSRAVRMTYERSSRTCASYSTSPGVRGAAITSPSPAAMRFSG